MNVNGVSGKCNKKIESTTTTTKKMTNKTFKPGDQRSLKLQNNGDEWRPTETQQQLGIFESN